MDVSVPVLHGESSTLISHPLSLSENAPVTLQLRPVLGAQHIYVEVLDHQRTPLARLSAAAAPSETVTFSMGLQDGAVTLSCDKTTVIRHTTQRQGPWFYLSRLDAPGEGVDIAVLLDGTLLALRPPASDTALDGDQASPSEGGNQRAPTTSPEEKLGQIFQFVREIAERLQKKSTTVRVAVLAFGDLPLPQLTAMDLHSEYVLFPLEAQERRFVDYSAAELERSIRDLPSTSGGDYVDALAEGLAACDALDWRAAARRLCLVWGDSPGYSLEDPAPATCDVRVREGTVESALDWLHAKDTLVATVYDPLDTPGLKKTEEALRCETHTANQYRRLASWPALAFRGGEGEDPKAVLSALQGERAALVGRGLCPGVMVNG